MLVCHDVEEAAQLTEPLLTEDAVFFSRSLQFLIDAVLLMITTVQVIMTINSE